MALGRPLSSLSLSPSERQQLLDWSRRPKTAQALALRARIVLLSAAGHSNTEVARRVQVALATVGKWRQRFVLLRLDGLLDEPRPGTPRRLSDAAVERVLAHPRGVHRSTRELEHAIRGFIDHHNQNPKPFVWTKSADQILDSVARLCKRTLDSVH